MESKNKTAHDKAQTDPGEFQPQEMNTRFLENVNSINQARVVNNRYLQTYLEQNALPGDHDGHVLIAVKYFEVQDSSADPQEALMNPKIYA